MMATAVDSCAVCGNAACRLVSETAAWLLYECDQCGLLFKVGAKTHYESLGLDAYLVFDYDRSKEVDEICEVLRPYCPDVQGMKILEIGCGIGGILHELRSRGAHVFGIEPSHVAVEHAKTKFGLTTVFEGYLSGDAVSVQPDIILLLDVIEHLEDPTDVFEKIAGIMNEKTLLVVKTGDSESLLPGLRKERWAYVHLPQHVTFYCSMTLQYVCMRTGLFVDRMLRYRDAYGGIAWNKFTKNILKVILLLMSSRNSYVHRRLTIDLANDHLLAVIRKASRD